MDDRKKAEKKILILSLVLLALMAAFLLFVGVARLANTWVFPAGLGALLAIYWIVTDVLSVGWLNAFEGKTEDQKKSYYVYAALEAISFAGLTYFLVDMNGMTGAIIFLCGFMLKRKFKEEFQGKKEDAEEED